MSLIGVSISSSGPGPGNAIYFDTPKRHVAMQVITTGGVAPGSTLTVDLEGTMDWGTTWTKLATVTLTEPSGSVGASGFASSKDVPVIGIRANNTSVVPGSGGTPAVAANLCAFDE